VNLLGPNIEMVLEEKHIYSDGAKYPIGTLRRVTGWTGEARSIVTELCDSEESAERAMWRLSRNKDNEFVGKYDHVDNLIIEFDKLNTPVFGEEGQQEIVRILRAVADELEVGEIPFGLQDKDGKRVGWVFWR
jgi:hypothetical protein